MNQQLIPFPNEIHEQEGTIEVTDEWTIISSKKYVHLSKYMTQLFSNKIELHLKTEFSDEENKTHSIKSAAVILLSLDSHLTFSSGSSDQNEGYNLQIQPDQIKITGKTDCGVFYGIQSLFQLLLQNKDTFVNFILPCICIQDYPRFPYRGFMLDVGRHFHSVKQVKELLDIMALFKLNKFHWHLTEDQGWRIEIKQYPKLTEIGSERDDTQIGGFLSKKYRGEGHKGYYSQTEIKDVIAYASERFIEVIPEIDLPGHSRAALAAYPEMSCKKEALPVSPKFGIFPTIFCGGQEKTYTFLFNILNEIVDLFPSSIVHIGGDEAPKKYWKSCPACQAKIKEEKLQNENELQAYFTNRLGEYLASKGKSLMGWNEITSSKLRKDAIIQFWIKGESEVINAMEKGHRLVNSHFFHYYLDYKYCMHPLKKVYNYEPLFSDVSKEAKKNLIGIESPLWTEWVPNRSRLHYQAFPRLFAMAESAWTITENKNYKRFKANLKLNYPWMQRLGINLPPFSKIDPHGLSRTLKMLRVRKMPLI